MNPFDLPQAEGKKQMYTRDRGQDGKFTGSLLMGNSIPAEIAVGHKEDISKRSLLPRMIKPQGIPKPPKPAAAPGSLPKMPKPATVPATRVASAGAPRIKQTGLGVRKSLYASVPTTKKEQRRERMRNATSAGLFSGGATAGLTAAMNGGRRGALRAAGQGAMVMAPIGAALGAAQRPQQRKMVQVRKRGERGELKAYQFTNHEHVRTTRRRGDKVLARERLNRKISKLYAETRPSTPSEMRAHRKDLLQRKPHKYAPRERKVLRWKDPKPPRQQLPTQGWTYRNDERTSFVHPSPLGSAKRVKSFSREVGGERVSKMSPDPSAVHVMGMGRAPRSRAAAQAAAQKAARTRRLRPALLA